MRSKVAPSLTAAMFLAMAAVGHAEAQSPGEQAMPDPPDREELVTFARAYIAVTEVQAELSEQVATAESPEEANQIQREAETRVTGILAEHELEPDRYREIAMVLNADDELRAEFQTIYEELIEDPGPASA